MTTLPPNIRERHFEVDSNFVDWRLDRFLSNRLGRLSRTKAALIIKHGDLSITPERKLKPSLKLRQYDVVTLREHLPDEVVQDHQVQVLYEDDDLLVLNKPSGMLVHESTRVRQNTIQGYLERDGRPHAEAAHRLDRETSGVLICAPSRAHISLLRGMFASEHPEKIYRAIVCDPHERWREGQRETLTWPMGILEGPVLSLRMGPGALECTTHVEPLGCFHDPKWGRMVDVQVIIETGRQHQIRVHLDMAGTHIAGDKLYGQTDEFFMASCDDPLAPEILENLPFPRHALHAWRMRMPHPARPNERVSFEAPLPDYWARFDHTTRWPTR